MGRPAAASGAFSIIRNWLLKFAVNARETGGRIELAFAGNCPDARLFSVPVGT
jgi:hypothetical protein